MDLNQFRNPPRSARPMVRWWWPGLDVDKAELEREVADLDQSGLGGAELQPFLIGSPMKMSKTDAQREQRTHRFMQPYHYEMMAAVLAEASRRGLTIDITQNSAWPTGGTHISLADSAQTLLFGETVVAGPRLFNGPVPPLKPLRLYAFLGRVIPLVMRGLKMIEYLPEDKKLVRVVAGKLLGRKGKFTSWKIRESARLDPNSMVDLTGHVSGGQLEWEVPEGRWQVFAFYAGTAGAYPLMDARSAPGKNALVVDHFNADALRRHLEAFLGQPQGQTGEPGQGQDASLLRPYFGKTLRAIFTDSFELISPMHWTHDFLEEFERRRGYDVTPYLPATYIPLKDVGYFTYGNELNLPNFDFPGTMGRRIRYDFQRTLSELFIEEFICAAAGWAEEHGIQSRVQGYGNLADPLQMLGRSHIPETEQLYAGGALHFLKLTGSAATLYKRPLATSETLVWSGRPYMTTPLKWRVGLDRLFESGINQAIYHGFPYRHPDYPFPGFQPFASPHMPPGMGFSSDMSRDNPLLFASAPVMNGYAARAQYLLQESKTCAAVGLFYQLFDFPNGNYIQEELVQGVLDDLDAQVPKSSFLIEMVMPTKPVTSGDRGWVAETAALGSELVANGWYYQFFNEDSLLRAEVRGKKVVMGEAEFSALVLYKETSLPAAAAEKLQQLAQAGIPVLFVGSKPSSDPGYFEHETRDESVQRAMASIRTPVLQTPVQVVDALKSGGIHPQVGYEHAQKKLGFIHKAARQETDPIQELYFLRSRSRKEQTVTVTLGRNGRVPVELDLWTGEVTRLAFEPAAHGQVKLGLTFPGYSARMIGLVDEATAAGLPQAALDLRENELTPVWTLTNFDFSATLRKADGSTRPVELVIEEPADWRSEPETRGLYAGTYSIRFKIARIQPGQRTFLCFDQVCDRADITLNGQVLPPLLVMPWCVEISEALREGENELSIAVTSTLRNTLVEYGNKGAKLYAQYRKQVSMPAGLIGAVKVCVKK